jgi:hypothetical protein
VISATHFGLALLGLLLVGVLSSLRVGGVRGEQWDVMSAWQREQLMRERHAANPALRGRR